jgi:hypothetical protein
MFFEIGFFEIVGVILPILLFSALANKKATAGSKLLAVIVALVVGSLLAAIVGYFFLPPIAPPFGESSVYILILWALCGVVFVGLGVTGNMAVTGMVILSLLLATTIVANFSIGWDVVSSQAFVDVAGSVTIHEEGDQNIIDVSHPLLVTQDQAMRKANSVANSFGDQTNLIRLDHPTLGDDANYYVVAEPAGYWRWGTLLESGGMPGYVKVNADDPTLSPEVVVLPESKRIKYSPYSFFGHNSFRMLRAAFPGSTVYKTYFHVNSQTGAPEFVFSLGRPTLGYYIAVPKKLVVQDANTGVFSSYQVGEQPAEYQFVFTQDMLANRVDDWGSYRSGWKAHAFGGANLEHVARADGSITREGWPVIQQNKVKYYLPMQWRTSRGNIQGVMIADASSGKLDLYIQPATDPDQVRLKLDSIIPQKARGNWEAAEPKEYQIGDSLKIWLAPYETTSTVGKSFQGVGATDLDADIAVYGESLDQAVEAIRARMLESEKFRSLLATERSEVLTINQLETREEAGNTVFYFTVNEFPGVTFRSSYQITPNFIGSGSKIQVGFLETSHRPEKVEAVSIKAVK